MKTKNYNVRLRVLGKLICLGCGVRGILASSMTFLQHQPKETLLPLPLFPQTIPNLQNTSKNPNSNYREIYAGIAPRRAAKYASRFGALPSSVDSTRCRQKSVSTRQSKGQKAEYLAALTVLFHLPFPSQRHSSTKHPPILHSLCAARRTHSLLCAS